VIRAEFTIYPFVEGPALPRYVQAAVDAISAAGLDIEIGPLSQTVTGEAESVLEAVRSAASAAFADGARRVVLNIEAVGE
jgi:uncharacterized protein YqgV (UPF0045/DUF77 family)